MWVARSVDLDGAAGAGIEWNGENLGFAAAAGSGLHQIEELLHYKIIIQRCFLYKKREILWCLEIL